MSCLVHDKRFRSSFHNIINELRIENCMPVSVLRTMPNKCCTCKDEIKETTEPAVMKGENQFIKLQNLIDRVHREKQTNPKLLLSLNRLEHLVEENRTPASLSSEISQQKSPNDSSSSSDSDDRSSSSDSEDVIPMETSKPIKGRRKQPNGKVQKPAKPVKSGTFLFLPYASKGKTKGKHQDSLVDVAKKLQRNRFIGPNGYISLLEKQYDVRINMITPKTSKQGMEALENAKKGLENLTIYNPNRSVPISDKQEGEWVLVRSKKAQNQTNKVDFEQALDALTTQ
jgi:hypothetical protein